MSLIMTLAVLMSVGVLLWLAAVDRSAHAVDFADLPLSDEEAWSHLPPALHGSGQPLPGWARSLAAHLPRTTAALLELDQAQRTRSPIEPALRARMRWVVAHANRSEYGRAYALADLERTTGNDASTETLAGDPGNWPEPYRDPLEFARRLTIDAPSIPDELFAHLRAQFGDHAVSAMVLLVAYGNFQDRLALGLGLSVEPGGPLLPSDLAFERGAFQEAPLLPASILSQPPLTSGPNLVERGLGRPSSEFDALQARLEHQRLRTPRLRIPSWDEVKTRLPAALAGHPTRIAWSLVCLGYAPELAVPWSVFTRTLWAEAPQDRVFEESLFWLQTREVRCNYCMGHCEMLLELAGLDEDAVNERLRRLAAADWSSFAPAEQRTFALARILTTTPWSLSSAHLSTLARDFGARNAAALLLWLCRGLYMTRVSDGFQLPLERDNVFEDHTSRSKAETALPDSAPRPKT